MEKRYMHNAKWKKPIFKGKHTTWFQQYNTLGKAKTMDIIERYELGDSRGEGREEQIEHWEILGH